MISILLVVAAMAFAIGVSVGILIASGGPAGFRARMAERRRKREVEREKRRFKLVGTVSAPVQHTYFGGIDGGISREYAYLYENAYGERKVKTTESVMDDIPTVVSFLAGKSLAEVQRVSQAEKERVAKMAA